MNFEGKVYEIKAEGMKTISNDRALRINQNRLIRLPLQSKNINFQNYSGNLKIQRLNVVRIKTN